MKAREIERAEVERMLKEGVIEPSDSEWASPVVLIQKPYGTLRFCIDYKKLNALTIRDSYPIPIIDEFKDTGRDAEVFSTLDMNFGYWKVPVNPSDRDKTTFICHYGLYNFVRMPFGLKKAAAIFPEGSRCYRREKQMAV